MKIAVIDHIGNHGGGSRVVRSLLPAFKRLNPEMEITYFGNPSAIVREKTKEEFLPLGINVVELSPLRLFMNRILSSEYGRRAIDAIKGCGLLRLAKKIESFPEGQIGSISGEIEKRVRDFDLAFYPWPFYISFPNLSCPSVGIFHDFNYKYYFSGSFVISKMLREKLERDIPVWLGKCVPVVSSKFMDCELKKFYPKSLESHVIHLPPLGGADLIPDEYALDLVRGLGINTPYLLCPTHMCSHKNVGPLIAAMALLRKRGYKISLILTGSGTESIRGNASDIGVELNEFADEIRGLGYVSNLHMDSLIQLASVVVNPSLYEAGNGPGVDAWLRGTPVAMSNIPSFAEHFSVLGVRGQIFDARNPQDIAEKISVILDNPKQARLDAEISRAALDGMSWDSVAAAYLQLFYRTVDEHKSK